MEPDDVEATTADRLRSVAVAASAAAMVLVPTLGPVLAGTREGAEEYDTEITPPGYAFAIWAPIFAAGAANAVQHAARPTATVNRRSGWWLAGAYGLNATWSLVAQSGRFRYTPVILPIAAALAGTAHRRSQRVPAEGAQRLVPLSAGLLSGWTGVASVVNVLATRRRGRLATGTRTGREAARVASIGAALALTATIATSRRGYVPVAAAGSWAFATTAADPRREPRTRTTAALAAALVAGTAAIKLGRHAGS